MESANQPYTRSGQILPVAVERILKLRTDPRFDFQAEVRKLTPHEIEILAAAMLNRSRRVW
jgi:hypothetical protein